MKLVGKATIKQKAFMKRLGIRFAPGISKRGAHSLIKNKLEQEPWRHEDTSSDYCRDCRGKKRGYADDYFVNRCYCDSPEYQRFEEWGELY